MLTTCRNNTASLVANPEDENCIVMILSMESLAVRISLSFRKHQVWKLAVVAFCTVINE